MSKTVLSESKNILLVDNEVTYLMPYVGGLEDCGYRVTIARNPKECMSLLEKEQFDAVIVDIMLPHGDEFSREVTQGGSQTGLALARWITKKFPKVFVVGLSVRASRDVSDWFDNKAAGFWSKNEVLEISSFTRRVDKLFQSPANPRIFIVHGQDDATKAVTSLRTNGESELEPLMARRVDEILRASSLRLGASNIESTCK